MRPIRALLAVSATISLFSQGCTEDVGPCDDPLMGQDTVLVGKQIQYGGQAIMNASCASTGICHSSLAKGDARHGAPAGLNFDVAPLSEGATGTDGTLTDTKGNVVVNLTADSVRGLRDRQRKIFETRNEIWQQVKDGLMPPPGKKFASFVSLALGIKDTDEKSPCTAKSNATYQPISTKPTEDILRNWLACNVPIVEAQGADVAENGVNGQAGYQYQSCTGSTTPPSGDGGTGGDGGSGGGDAGGNGGGGGVAFDDIYSDIIMATACSTCHPALNPNGVKIDFSTEDKTYASLVTDTAMKCNGKPYVTPGDPSMSWLYDVVSTDNPGCGTERMPQGSKLTAAQIKEISDWITQGALRTPSNKSVSALAGGLDAGL